jgi:hypothetical protein
MTPTSRASEDMLSAACDAFIESPGAFQKLAYPLRVSIRRDMRAALEAALSTMGDVVAVNELQSLVDEWESRNLRHNANSFDLGMHDGYRDAATDLSAILNRGGK